MAIGQAVIVLAQKRGAICVIKPKVAIVQRSGADAHHGKTVTLARHQIDRDEIGIARRADAAMRPAAHCHGETCGGGIRLITAKCGFQTGRHPLPQITGGAGRDQQRLARRFMIGLQAKALTKC